MGERSPTIHQNTVFIPRRDPPPLFFFAMPSIADDISLEYVHSLSLSLLSHPAVVCLSAETQAPPGLVKFRSTLPEPLTKRRQRPFVAVLYVQSIVNVKQMRMRAVETGAGRQRRTV